MEIVFLISSEMEAFVDFKLKVEKNEFGRVLSNPEYWHSWARSQNIPQRQFVVAKGNEGQWLGAIHWSPLGSHEAKVFPLLRVTTDEGAEKVELSSRLLGRALHEILRSPEIEQVVTRPFSGQMDDSYRIALVRAGFQLFGDRIEFQSYVEQLPKESSNIIDWRPVLKEEDLQLAADVFKEVCVGDPHSLDVLSDPLGCIREALSEKELTHDLCGIHLGYVNGFPAAYVHVQINPSTGWSRITYMGIVLKFRKTGLGEHVHRHAFTMIRDLGGTLYHGGTSAQNKAMVRLFEKSNCIKFAEMQEWRLEVKKYRERISIRKLITARLSLEPMQAHHAAACFEPFQDEQIYRFIRREPPKNYEEFAKGFAFLESRLSPDLSECWWNWVCFENNSERTVGTVEVSFVPETGEAHLAYTIFPQYWRNGFAKEACSKVVDFLFSQKSVKKIVIEMDVRNAASVALAESLGAKRRCFTEKVQILHGEWSDEFRYELLNY